MKSFSSKVTTQHEYGKLNACTHACFCYHYNFAFACTRVVLMNAEELEKQSGHELFLIFYLWS